MTLTGSPKEKKNHDHEEEEEQLFSRSGAFSEWVPNEKTTNEPPFSPKKKEELF
jgi:hypothetical protein